MVWGCSSDGRVLAYARGMEIDTPLLHFQLSIPFFALLRFSAVAPSCHVGNAITTSEKGSIKFPTSSFAIFPPHRMLNVYFIFGTV